MLAVSDVGRVRLMVLDRPAARNAFIPELSAAIVDALKAAHADDGVGAIVIAGNGPAFCAGLDLKFADIADTPTMRRLVDSQQEIARQLLLGPKPVVAAVHGHAVGGGMELALACDLIVWGEGAEGWFPEVPKGLAATGAATLLLPLLVGLSRAKEMMLLAGRWSGMALKQIGLVHSLVPADAVRPAALDMAARLAAMPPAGLAFAKRSLSAGARAALEEALAAETDAAMRPFV